MVLPLNLAMTPSEIASSATLPKQLAWMDCHFSALDAGIAGIPKNLPKGSMLILTDRIPCRDHSRELVTARLSEAVQRLGCCSVLLDFQRSWEAQSQAMVKAIAETLPCPVAATEGFAKDLSCAVFLSPCPLHLPLEKYLQPWLDREVWLEAALCREEITVTKAGSVCLPVPPLRQPEGGFYEKALRCRYQTAVSKEAVTFTLFDTKQTLKQKLAAACALGVRRLVGLYQQLGPDL